MRRMKIETVTTPSAANSRRANTPTGSVHLDVGANKVGGDTSAIKMGGDTEHVVESVTMPRAANNKRADTTAGTVHLDVGAACETVKTREVGASTKIHSEEQIPALTDSIYKVGRTAAMRTQRSIPHRQSAKKL